jgi:hypothetical protein
MIKQPWDDPNHEWYGPVRRMWLILAYLKLDSVHTRYGPASIPWQEALINRLNARIWSEAECARVTLGMIFDEMVN